MADISKITPPGSQTTYNLKDATAREQALIAADQTTQYNYSSVSSMSGTSGFTSTYYFDRPIPTGTYRLVCTNVRTDTSKQCQFQVVGANPSEQYTNLSPTISTANYATNEFTTTFDLYGIKVYCNTPIEITNLSIIPKTLYDAGFTSYQPYALPNTKITPELIDLVDSGAKNLLPVSSATSALNYFDITVNIKAGTYVVYFGSLSTTDTSSTEMQVAFYKVPDRKAFTGVKVGTNNYRVVTIPEDIEVVRVYPTANAATSTGYSVTFSNMMLCTKAAWDVSQKFVPYRPSYEETVEQVAENKNNILSKIGASDYATQNTGGTVRVWTTTDGTDTILHIANEAPTP